MAWQSDLASMKKYGTLVRASCQACPKWWDVDLDEMIAEIGSDRCSLWDRYPPCIDPACDGVALCLASPGESTPYRPLMSGDLPSDYPLPIASRMDGWVGLWATPPRAGSLQ